jgi:hypothetical protein
LPLKIREISFKDKNWKYLWNLKKKFW